MTTPLTEFRLFEVKGCTILGNPRNGALMGLDETGRAFVERLLTDGVRSADCYLGEQRRIVEALAGYGYLDAPTVRPLRAAYVHLTDRCNLHCVGCYSFVTDRNRRRDLTTEELKVALDKLAASGCRSVTFSGGEPFLRSDIAEVCGHAKGLGMHVALITNGTIPPSRCEAALPWIDVLNVSVDGYDESSRFIRDDGIMPRVLEFVRTMKQRTTVHLVFTLHKKAVGHIDDYLALARGEGVTNNFSIFTVAPDDEAFEGFVLDDEALHQIADAMTRADPIVVEDTAQRLGDGVAAVGCSTGCGAGRGIVSVAADGTVYPCHMLHDEQLAMGDILSDDLADVLRRQEQVTGFTVDEVEGCSECEHRYLCGGGCRGRSFLYHGVPDRKDPFCHVLKEYLDRHTEIFATL